MPTPKPVPTPRQAIWLLAAIALAPTATAAPPALREADFETLHALMQARPDEVAWLQIPWHTNLWDARVEAAKTGKPIYLWEMDGHPLGCS